MGDACDELPHWAETVDAERVAFLDSRILDPLPRGRQDVAEKELAMVRQFIAHTDGVEISVGNEQVLGLFSRDRTIDF